MHSEILIMNKQAAYDMSRIYTSIYMYDQRNLCSFCSVYIEKKYFLKYTINSI